ncbi:aminotransferase class V-fold PLP-dependent enzyme, partial [Paraburkholderia sp. BR14264]|uniref:ADP-ribosylglycohydrolase family protein n=1 Tax=Paraburkholderia sp. BR14264 TaxID=3237001 RepID=UPI00397877A7
MAGGGSFGWAPGEWTDDTSMAVPILRTVARGGDPASEEALDGLVAAWAAWSVNAPDVGIQTRNVLAGLEARLADASDVALVTFLWANNEVGTIQPVSRIVELAHAAGVPVHSDAVAAYGQVPVSFAASGLDAVSVS